MQKSGEDDVNTAVDDSKWKVYKSKGRFNKCKMKNLERADRQMTTANKGTLTITSVSDAGNLKVVYYAPKASNNLVDIYEEHHGQEMHSNIQ